MRRALRPGTHLPLYGPTSGYGVDFPFENYERMADFMRRYKGKVMLSINGHPDIRRVFEGVHFEATKIRYTTTNQRQGRAEVTGELIVMSWEPSDLGGFFSQDNFLKESRSDFVRVSNVRIWPIVVLAKDCCRPATATRGEQRLAD